MDYFIATSFLMIKAVLVFQVNHFWICLQKEILFYCYSITNPIDLMSFQHQNNQNFQFYFGLNLKFWVAINFRIKENLQSNLIANLKQQAFVSTDALWQFGFHGHRLPSTASINSKCLLIINYFCQYRFLKDFAID